MGYGIKLTEEQWDELDRVRFATKSADVFRNCLIIFKSDSRDTIASIAEDLGCSPDTVIRVRRLYREGGVDALKPIKPPGRPGKATPEFVDQMRRAVTTNPLTLGYGFSTWSLARLGRAPGQDHRHSRQHRPTGPPAASPRVLVPASQAHDERQAGRGGIRKIQGPTAGLKKKPSEKTPPRHWFSRTRSRYIATRR